MAERQREAGLGSTLITFGLVELRRGSVDEASA
jgi:hypothetical protein